MDLAQSVFFSQFMHGNLIALSVQSTLHSVIGCFGLILSAVFESLRGELELNLEALSVHVPRLVQAAAASRSSIRTAKLSGLEHSVGFL